MYVYYAVVVRSTVRATFVGASRFVYLGFEPPKGLLLHGPPGSFLCSYFLKLATVLLVLICMHCLGCGKTMLAYAIAGEWGIPLIKVWIRAIDLCDILTKIHPTGYCAIFKFESYAILFSKSSIFELRRLIVLYIIFLQKFLYSFTLCFGQFRGFMHRVYVKLNLLW